MPKRIDDNDEAMNDIANSPDISGGADAQHAVATPKPPAVIVAADDGAADRNARLFTGNVNKAYKSVTGKELDKDQLDAAAEIAGMAFSGLMSFGLPRLAYGGILTAIMLIPFAPPMWKLLMGAKNKGENNG